MKTEQHVMYKKFLLDSKTYATLQTGFSHSYDFTVNVSLWMRARLKKINKT